ncbi:complement decay-accelerating factor, GPI-anchored-like isoform X2 [Phyllobates terribilis]|uniref:complement decay-accelerating factor, GPI-anchored-like isoform X2 n=1 Tax=Phyllobates terribilis TaxID=111132 RepID=UPI003CCA8D3F
MSSTQTTQWNLIRIMLCSTLAATIYGNCPKPPPLSYAVPDADNDTYTEGDKVHYSCSAGYISIPSINNIATCDADGKWTTFPEAFCRRICPKPQNLSYAVPSSEKESYVEGDIVTYSCLPTYKYIPDSNNVSSCGDDGKWSTFEKVFCEKLKCRIPDILQNGKVDFSDTVIGSTASYTCLEGFKLVGNPYRECLGEGIWIGSNPTCQRSCPDPPVPKYAQINEIPDLQYFPVDIIIVYSCLPGYKYDPFVLPIVQCLEGFTWSNINEFCKSTI